MGPTTINTDSNGVVSIENESKKKSAIIMYEKAKGLLVQDNVMKKIDTKTNENVAFPRSLQHKSKKKTVLYGAPHVTH